MKTTIKLFKKAVLWYFNKQAENYERLFHGRTDIPWWM